MKVNNLTNFNGDIYLTNRFSESGITVQDTSNAIVFNAHSNSGSSQIKYFWHEPYTYSDYNDEGEWVDDLNGFLSTSLTIGKKCFSYSFQNWVAESHNSNAFICDNNGFTIVADTAYDNYIIRSGRYRFDGGGFNFNDVISSGWQDYGDTGEFWQQYLSIGVGNINFDAGETVINTGITSIHTSDFIMVNFAYGDNGCSWEHWGQEQTLYCPNCGEEWDGNYCQNCSYEGDNSYEKTKIDIHDTINISQKNLINWGQRQDTNLSEIQLSNSQVNINIKNITLTEGEYQTASKYQSKYEFRYNGLYFNGHAPNTAGGFAMLDSNSRIPGMVAASKVKFNMNSNSYVLKLTLKDSSSNSLSSDTVDLPLESMVVNGRYNSNSKSVVLTLKNGNEVSFSVADLVNGLQKSLTASNGIAIDSNSNISCTGNITIGEEDENSEMAMSYNHIGLYVADSNMADGTQFNMSTSSMSISGNDQNLGFNQTFSGSNIALFVTNNNYGDEGVDVHESTFNINPERITYNFNGIDYEQEVGTPYSNSIVFTNEGDIQINNHGINQAQGLVQLDSNSRIPDASYQHIEKVVKTLATYTSNNVVTISDLAPGLVVAVINDTGKQIYPDIQYVNGRAVITADFETNTPDTSWAIFKVNYLTF